MGQNLRQLRSTFQEERFGKKFENSIFFRIEQLFLGWFVKTDFYVSRGTFSEKIGFLRKS